MGLRDVTGQPAAASLHRALSRGRLGQAYLFAGPPGAGKTLVARELAKAVLCETPTDRDACGKCRSCLLADQGAHPDIEFFRPEAGQAAYPVRQLRGEIRARAYLRPALGSRRFLILERAEALVKTSGARNEGADTLLKLLEEPAADTSLVLITDQPEALPETIRSRCQVVLFRGEDTEGLVGRLVEIGLDQETARFASVLAQGRADLALDLASGKRERARLESLRRQVTSAASFLGTMSYPELLEVAAVLDDLTREQAVLVGAMGVLASLYRDAAVRRARSGESGLVFPSGEEASVTIELARRLSAATLVAAAARALQAGRDAGRHPARLLFLEVLILDLRSLVDRDRGGVRVE